MTTVFPFPFVKPQYFDSSGNVLANGTINTYLAGTTTPVATYTDATGTTQNPVSITLGADGRPPNSGIYGDEAVSYKIEALDSSGTVQWTIDQVEFLETTISAGSNISVSSNTVSLFYPQTAAEIAAGVTPTNYYRPPGEIYRYGAVGDGVTDDTTAIQTAIDVAAAGVPSAPTYNFGSVKVYLPGNESAPTIYLISSISIPTGVILEGYGGIVIIKGTSPDVIVDTTLYSSGTSPHYNGGFINLVVIGTQTSSVTNVGLRINNAQNFIVEHARFYNLGGCGLQVQTQFNGTTTGNTGLAQSITVTAYDVRVFQCTLAVTSNTNQYGSFDIQGTDHEFTDCETFSGVVSGPSYQGGKRIGWMIRGVSGSSWVRCRGDLHDTGWYFDTASNYNTQKSCLTLSSFAQGLINYGYRNRFDVLIDTASYSSTGTYDAIENYGVNNNFSGRVSNNQDASVSPRYAFNEQNVVATEPTFIDPLFRCEAWTTAPLYIINNGAVSWDIQATSAPLGLTTNSTTPAITTANTQPVRRFITQNTSATEYSDFTGGWAGQRISVLVNDAFTSFGVTGNIQNRTGAAITAVNGVIYELEKKPGGAWIMLNNV